MKHSIRSKVTGKFISSKAPAKVVAGRLYSYKGIVVRANARLAYDVWLVSSHKNLTGYVRESELSLIDRKKVQEYLENA